jgi:hypothetical protein
MEEGELSRLARNKCFDEEGLVYVLALKGRIRAQPRRGMAGCIVSLTTNQIVAKCVRVCFVVQLGQKALESLPRVVLPFHVFNNSLEVAYELRLPLACASSNAPINQLRVST